MKIWHISDTHGYHDLLEIPKVNMVIHSGDASNQRLPHLNIFEYMKFLKWFGSLNIKYKIIIAGNHDSSIESGSITIEDFTDKGIIYLENTLVNIKGIKIWGSPYTPNFGNWSFMKNRSKLDKVWKQIPIDIDIVVTHTPPKGILDISENRDHTIEYCGCNALKKNMIRIEPKLHLFGHIHNSSKDIINAGTMKLSMLDTIFSNGSVVTDGKFGKLSSNGNILKL